MRGWHGPGSILRERRTARDGRVRNTQGDRGGAAGRGVKEGSGRQAGGAVELVSEREESQGHNLSNSEERSRRNKKRMSKT